MLAALLATSVVAVLLFTLRRRWAAHGIEVSSGLLGYGAFLAFILSAFAVDAFAVTGLMALLAAGLVTAIIQLAVVRTVTAWTHPDAAAREWGIVDGSLSVLVFGLLLARPSFLLAPAWSGVFVLELLLVAATAVLLLAPSVTRTIRVGESRVYLPAAGLGAAGIALATTALVASAS